MSYFLFLYRSPSCSSGSVLDAVSTNIDRALSKCPTGNMFVFGNFNVHHIEWLKHLCGTDQPDIPLISLLLMTLLRLLIF